MQALPAAAYFLLLEAACGGSIALVWVHLRGEVSRGFTLFTGLCLLIIGILAVWLRFSFPPVDQVALSQSAEFWFALERTLSLAFVVLFGLYLIDLRARTWPVLGRLLAPLLPLLALGALWAASLVDATPQLFGLGTPLAVVAGGLALGSALTGLSLGHWYLVSPTLSVRPLVQVTFLTLGALAAQTLLVPVLLFGPGAPAAGVQGLFGEYAIFLGVRLVFGLLVPLAATIMTWRTARIRSLDSATGLLYIVAALILAGEIAARTLAFLTGVST